MFFGTFVVSGSSFLYAHSVSCRPIIEEANKVAPAFSKLYKEFILLSNPRKPLPRAGKGTVMRKAALADYHDEIEAL